MRTAFMKFQGSEMNSVVKIDRTDRQVIIDKQSGHFMDNGFYKNVQQ